MDQTRPGRIGPRAKGTGSMQGWQCGEGEEGAVGTETGFHQGEQGSEGTEQKDSGKEPERIRECIPAPGASSYVLIAIVLHGNSLRWKVLEDSPTTLSTSRLDSNSPELIEKFQNLFRDPSFFLIFLL